MNTEVPLHLGHPGNHPSHRWADAVGSLTAGLDWRPVAGGSLRLEYREDHASRPIYFAGRVAGDGVQLPFVPTASGQRTVTAGLVASF